ncbi:alpha/beta hydrolase fold-1 [Cordyceps militaris CM01]|uniref:Alpha/beta hydrolase fold-1 n=1 Tax=Cordyceps militaris (strain CM01) TaxID=983644 RepID=G3JRG4_CORMM|nr:alpha/beta hydrolase fold-1 [Cordyceps militaris CM01]EGX88514.1 alpha/beta hydrolase fold-1 [Cordyceps militaris CM01]
MRLLRSLYGLGALLSSVDASPVPEPQPRSSLQAGLIMTNDFTCKSDKNPVIVLHGLFANRNLDLNFFEAWARPQGYCTYGLTYGAHPAFPSVGGVQRVAESSQQIVALINEVLQKSGAKKVDLVGHSEGGLQALYVAKVRKMSAKIDKIVAIAPPSHGTEFSRLINIANLLLIRTEVDKVLTTVGCPACLDVADGDAIKALNDGPIVQPGNKVTIIATKYDTIVTPAVTASFINEPGVYNVLTQNVCPLDFAGHINLALDANMFQLTLNALQDKNGKSFICTLFSGFPFKN